MKSPKWCTHTQATAILYPLKYYSLSIYIVTDKKGYSVGDPYFSDLYSYSSALGIVHLGKQEQADVVMSSLEVLAVSFE